MAETEYELDEFDRLAETFPAGAHRRPVKRWRKILPFVLVIVIAPLLGWGAFIGFKNSGNALPDIPKKTEKPQVTQEQPSTPTPSETQSSEQPTEPDRSIAVTVLNGSNINGAAGRAAQTLINNGYVNVQTGDTSVYGLSESSIYYSDESYRVTAENIAKFLGINVVMVRTDDIDSPDGIAVFLLGEAQTDVEQQ